MKCRSRQGFIVFSAYCITPASAFRNSSPPTDSHIPKLLCHHQTYARYFMILVAILLEPRRAGSSEVTAILRDSLESRECRSIWARHLLAGLEFPESTHNELSVQTANQAPRRLICVTFFHSAQETFTRKQGGSLFAALDRSFRRECISEKHSKLERANCLH